MAKLPDGSGDAYSNLVQGDGSASLTFVMPGTVPLAVGSVVATVDNTAGADTTATLVIRDSSGEVIATKRQSATIDAGASGTATWALRLDDDPAGATTALKSEKFLNLSQDTITASSDAFLTWVHNDGDTLLDLASPTSPTMIAGGVYAFTMSVEIQRDIVNITSGALFTGIMSIFPPFTVEAAVGQFTYSAIASITPVVTATLVVPVAAGTLCRFDALSTFTSSVKARLFGRVQQVG